MFPSKNTCSLVSVHALTKIITLFIALSTLALLALSAGAQTQNHFDSRIDAHAGILSGADISAPTSTISGAAGEFSSASITDGTAGLTIGDTITITLRVIDGTYHSTINSTTNIPIRINGENKQVQIIGGAAISGGTTSISSRLEVVSSPLRIVGAATDTIALQLTKSASDLTGLRAYLDTSSNTVIFKNNMPTPSWEFSPGLTSANDVTVYAHHIVIAATDSTDLLSWIDTAINAVAWDTLETATGTTIKEYIQDVSGEILAHSERLVDATGTRLIDYIENRITTRLNVVITIANQNSDDIDDLEDDVSDLQYEIDLIKNNPISETVLSQIANDLYAFNEPITEGQTSLTIDLPFGKKFKPDGAFLILVNGVSFTQSATIIQGYGDTDAGIYVSVYDRWGGWSAGSAYGHVQVADAGAWNPAANASDEIVRKPKTAVSKFGFCLKVINED